MTGAGFKARLARGDKLSGVWSTIDDPVVARVLGNAGFDFATVDLQHGYADLRSAVALISAFRRSPTVPLVRVPPGSPDAIGRALDLGAEGVIVPMVDSAEDALAAARACRYGPAGARSWGPLWQGLDAFPEAEEADARTACIVMVETMGGFEAIEKIAATPGVDAVYIGPNDLALGAGLGRVSFTTSSALHDLIAAGIARANAAGMRVGVDCRGPEQARYWQERGADFVISVSDVALLDSAGRAASAAAAWNAVSSIPQQR